MSRLQQFQEQPFWAWAVSGQDMAAELEKAVTLYRQRHQREPHLVFCHQETQLEPMAGLQIERHSFVPRRTLYFAIDGEGS